MANWNHTTLSYDNQSTRHEVVMVANSSGVIYDKIPVSIDSMPASGGSDLEYKLKIAQGQVAGYTPVFVHGFKPSFTNGIENSFWGGETIYPWSAWTAAGTLSIVSSQNDTGDVTIYGLDSNYDQITETKTITGTSPVTTTNSFIRINKITYSDGSVNSGNISFSRGGTVVGYITAQAGASQMAQYTIPAGYTGYVINGTANIGKGNDGLGYFKYRLFEQTFQHAFTFLIYQGSFNYEFGVPLVIPEKTDLDVVMTASNSGTAASCAYGILLVAN